MNRFEAAHRRNSELLNCLMTGLFLLGLLFVLFLTVLTAVAADETQPVEPPSLEPTLELTKPPAVTPTYSAMTATPTHAASPTQVPTEIPDYAGDLYEPDSNAFPQLYTGPTRRVFSPANDIDYIALYVKPGTVVFETFDLTGAADTHITVFDRVNGFVQVIDDDGGDGLASRAVMHYATGMEVIVQIENKSLGYGSGVGYSFHVVQEAEQTPTAVPTVRPTTQPTYTPYPTQTALPTYTPLPPTPAPTQTPRVITLVATPTAKPWPTATITPSLTPTPLPTATAIPTATPDWHATRIAREAAWKSAQTATIQPQPVVLVPARPAATLESTVYSNLRVELFTDLDNDNVLDAGEGMQQMLVEVSDFDNLFQHNGYATNGVLLVPITVDAINFQVAVPYLGETQSVTLGEQSTVQFSVAAPLLPIEFP